MKIQDIVRLLRSRWVSVLVTALITILAGVLYTLVQTPLYEASTRLFVSTTSGSSTADLYSGIRLSQDRVLSYTQLVMGQTLAQRTVDRLDLDMDAKTLQEHVTAKSKSNTVLINVSVLDASPVQARDIANALADEFVLMVRELETPLPGARPEARVVVEQRASLPEFPVMPDRKRNIAIAVLLGGLLGMGVAVLRELLDNTVKSQEALEETTGTSAVGYIPLDKKLVAIPAISFDIDNSGTAEAFRKLRTNLQFLSVDNPPRVIVLTSSSPGEGKTTTSINIALALAEADHNVVLVDGDLRRPRVAKYLDLVNSVGMSTVISGASTLDEVLQQTRFPHLTVMAAGQIAPNPSELLGSIAAKRLLSELRARFDYVIIDSSPLLAVTDGAILVTEADGAIIVVRAGKTTRDQLTHAVGMLNDVGARLLGAVLSMTPTRGAGSYSYNYYYSYGGSYGDRPSGSLLDSPLPDNEADDLQSDPPTSAVVEGLGKATPTTGQ